MNNDNIAAIEFRPHEPEFSSLWPDEPASDGRVARGQRTRRNVAEALCQLLQDGDPDPTAKSIAEQAGVSLRLVFHHFADMDDLYLFVAALQLRQQWTDLPRVSQRLSLPARIERTVSHRAALYEEISPVRRAVARRALTSANVAAVVASGDTM
jgi:TetR/AcrR family transcriptional regulator of autoinduction and epiphytic fitness